MSFRMWLVIITSVTFAPLGFILAVLFAVHGEHQLRKSDTV